MKENYFGLNAEDEGDQWARIKRLNREQHERCDDIDARTASMEQTFFDLVNQEKALNAQLSVVTGFWKRFWIHWAIGSIIRKINVNRDLRNLLYIKRWRNT